MKFTVPVVLAVADGANGGRVHCTLEMELNMLLKIRLLKYLGTFSSS